MNKIMTTITLVIVGLFTLFILVSNEAPIPYMGDFVLKPTSTPLPPTSIPTPQPTKEIASVSARQTLSENVISKIQTSKGEIEIMMTTKDAPKTIANFVQKAKSGYYNNFTFHRVEDWVVQGGDPKGDGTGGGNMTTELNNKPYVVGSVGVARASDIRISNDSQFFITKKAAPSLNGQYTNFGIVTRGMEVVNKIEIGDKILRIDIE